MHVRFVLLALSVVAIAAVGLTASFQSSHSVPTKAKPAAVSPQKAFVATHTAQIDDTVSVDISISLLPCVTLADGSVVRPMSMHALYQLQGGRYLGETRVHKLCKAASDEMIDLSIAGLDLAMHDATPNAPEKLRAYAAQVTPTSGKHWSDVQVMDEDVLVLVGEK